MENYLHFILQGKGGVGKSVTSVLLAQFLKSKDVPLVCLDTDPQNDTFAQYKGLDVAMVDIVDDSSGEMTVNPRAFDKMIEIIANTQNENFVIDNGAGGFLPIVSYIKTSGVFSLLQEMGKKIILHMPIAAGQALLPCLNDIKYMAETFPTVNIVLWENLYFGDLNNQRGQSYKLSPEYKAAQKHIHGIMTLQKLPESTLQKDFQTMLADSLTFDEIQENTDGKYSIMMKHRLKQYKQEIFNQLDEIFAAEFE